MSVHPHSVGAFKHAVAGDGSEDRNTDFSKSFGYVSFFTASGCHAGACYNSTLRGHKHEVAAENSIRSVFSLVFNVINLGAEISVYLSHLIVLSAHQFNVDWFVGESDFAGIKIFDFFSRSAEKNCFESIYLRAYAPVSPVFGYIFFEVGFLREPSFAGDGVDIYYFFAFTIHFLYMSS